MGKVEINPVALAEFVRSPEGPIARHMIVLAERVRVGAIASFREGFPRDFLGAQIVKRISMGSDGPHVSIEAVHPKTNPHPIEGNPVLVFEFPKNSGTVVFARHVNHPGSDFSEYVKKKLEEALHALKGTV